MPRLLGDTLGMIAYPPIFYGEQYLVSKQTQTAYTYLIQNHLMIQKHTGKFHPIKHANEKIYILFSHIQYILGPHYIHVAYLGKSHVEKFCRVK